MNAYKNRKKVSDKLHGLKHLKEMHKSFEKELIRVSGIDSYQQMAAYYDDVIQKLQEEKYSLPIGHRYTGTFYVKVPYTIPTEFKKVEGSAFMKESLVSWEIENGDGIPHQSYYRAIFRTPEHDSEIKREDSVPVFEKKAEDLNDI